MFYELEEKALSSSSTAAQSDSLWQQVKEVLEDPEAGTPKDRMRLFLVYFLCHPSLGDQDVERLCGILEVREIVKHFFLKFVWSGLLRQTFIDKDYKK